MVKCATIRQADMTSECWLIQFWGAEYCKTCAYRDMDDCGGRAIRRTGKNSKGISVPLSEEPQ